MQQIAAVQHTHDWMPAQPATFELRRLRPDLCPVFLTVVAFSIDFLFLVAVFCFIAVF